MPLVLFVLFSNLLSVVFGRFIDRNEADYYEKNWRKKLNKSVFPTEVLHRSLGLEYIKYRKKEYAKSRDYDVLGRIIPGIMLEHPTEPLVLTITDPDEQTVHLSVTVWDKNKDDGNRETASMFEKSVVSPTTKSTIQLSEHVVTTENDLLKDRELKRNPESSIDLEQQPNMSGTFEELNITEVYEEPFIRVYVKPLCKGPTC
ncbi:hypothetical protein LOAG_00447 [Loa loa]|uniref:Cadherin domain-containing protein n=1 Tax=Loa loa TaxID=7209 RepID=A0A1I7VMI2_LOALO|nr:hypothetical protein LOAG_00447 [Loa loa]EFO28031.1 hypothetical protein LOAG_00447 [Loa loa]